MAKTSDPYPVTLSVDFPDRPLDRLTSFFRIFVAIPILIVIGLLVGGASQGWEAPGWSAGYTAGGAVVLPTLLMILFRQKYPRWWFDWNLNLAKFGTRVSAYMMLLRDEYPSTDEEQAVHLEIPYPDAKQASRFPTRMPNRTCIAGYRWSNGYWPSLTTLCWLSCALRLWCV